MKRLPFWLLPTKFLVQPLVLERPYKTFYFNALIIELLSVCVLVGEHWEGKGKSQPSFYMGGKFVCCFSFCVLTLSRPVNRSNMT